MEMLDREGNPIESQFNYTLAPVKAALPATPMAMRGCISIWRMRRSLPTAQPVRKSAWRTMRSLNVITPARGNDSKPVLLTVDGHFTLEPNPDSGEMVKTLVADKDAKFVAGKDCNSK
jgi:copper homeostasis protein (lipoprotein)